MFRAEALPVPENRLVRAMKNRPEVAKTAPEQHFIPARKKGQHALQAAAALAQGRLRLAEVTKSKNLLVKTVREQPVILVKLKLKLVRPLVAAILLNKPVLVGLALLAPENVPTARLIRVGTALIQLLRLLAKKYLIRAVYQVVIILISLAIEPPCMGSSVTKTMRVVKVVVPWFAIRHTRGIG